MLHYALFQRTYLEEKRTGLIITTTLPLIFRVAFELYRVYSQAGFIQPFYRAKYKKINPIIVLNAFSNDNIVI